jgi:hypothetical protein
MKMRRMRRMMRIGHSSNKYYEDDCEDTNQKKAFIYSVTYNFYSEINYEEDRGQ